MDAVWGVPAARGGRPPAFDTDAYKQHKTAERACNKLKGFRAFAMCTDKREFVFQGAVDIRQHGPAVSAEGWPAGPSPSGRDR